MNTEQFFTKVWRVNAIIILLVGVIAAGVLSFAGYEIFKSITERRHVEGMVNIAPDGGLKEVVRFGGFSTIRGTPYLWGSLMTTQEYRVSSYNKEAGAIRNYLFYDTNVKKGHLLTKENDKLFLDASLLSETNSEEGDYLSKSRGVRGKKVLAILYEVVNKDTNGDGRLTAKDLHTIAVSSPSGSHYTEIIANIDSMTGHHILSPASVLIFYDSKSTLRAVEVDIPTSKILSDSVVIAGK